MVVDGTKREDIEKESNSFSVTPRGNPGRRVVHQAFTEKTKSLRIR